MPNQNTELAREWWEKSARDISAALVLAACTPKIYDYAIFHCQQAAEKAIKALLVFHGESFDKIHKLSDLINLAKKFDEQIDSKIGERNRLSKLAVETRYPGYGLGNSIDYLDALNNAIGFINYIKSKLPVDVTASGDIDAE